MSLVATRSIKTLQHKDIENLCCGEILVIRIPQFVDEEIINFVRNKLFLHENKGALGHAKEFTRLGIAYAEIKDEETREKYHDEAYENIQRIRNIFSPYISPMDHLRLVLDEVWPGGSRLLTVGEHKCFVGICRYLTPGIDLEPHIDNLEWSLPQTSSTHINYQLSSNIYLQATDSGGQLEMWRILPTPKEYTDLQGSRHYGIDRNKLPEPDVTVKPVRGDLFLLNPRFIHAVRPVHDIDRITLSSFIGINELHKPLEVWS